MAGDYKNPIAIDTYKNLYKCLDDEFFMVLSIYKWFKTGLLKIALEDISYDIALGVRYLIEYNEYLDKKDLLVGRF